MSSIVLATILQTAILATGVEAESVSSAETSAETYAEARRVTMETGKPVVVMVSTDWCPPCQVMKKSILPQIRALGLLKKVAFAMVNPDKDHELAEKLIGGGPIPQLVMFRKTNVCKKLVGGQSVETVEEFITEGLTKDAVEKKSATSPKSKGHQDNDQAASRHNTADNETAPQRG
jgi:thioredoxin-like negative regulator of GroEL